MAIEHVNYLGCYAPVFYENHSNPQVEKTVKKVEKEIAFVQAEQKIEFIQNMLAGHDLTKPERIALEYMLQNAKRDFAQLKIQNGVR